MYDLDLLMNELRNRIILNKAKDNNITCIKVGIAIYEGLAAKANMLTLYAANTEETTLFGYPVERVTEPYYLSIVCEEKIL